MRRAAHFITLLIPGLFAGRVLSELLRPGLLLAIILTLVTTVAGAFLLHYLTRRRATDRYPWLALPLLAYVLYPQLHLGLALAVAATTFIALALYAGQRLSHRLRAPSARLLAVLVFVVSLLFYVATLSPGLLPADNGELQLVAVRLGVAHPPGFALYTILAHLASRLPLDLTPAARVNLLSAFLAAATLSIVFLSAFRLSRSRFAALVAVIALATATTFWSQATTANVRILAAFFAALAIHLLLLYSQRHVMESLAHPAPGIEPPVVYEHSPGKATLLFLFGLTISLGITHHASLAFMALVLGLVVVWIDPALLRQPWRWAPPIAGLLLGLLPLLYFPLRAITAAGAAVPVRGSSPELATLSGFLEHVLALGFRGDLFAYTGPRELAARLPVMGNVMTFQFHWLILAAMLIGFLVLLRTRTKIAVSLGGAFALHTLVTATYRAPQTVEYMLPAYVPAVLLLAVAVAFPLPERWRQRPGLRSVRAVLAATLLVTAIAQGVQRYASFHQLSQDRTARDYASTIFAQAPANSVVLADWHWATPLWFLQEVEGQRPDLDIRYVFPTPERYGETWARRIAENLDIGRSVVATHFDSAAYNTLPPAEPLGDALLYRQEPRTTLPASFTSLSATLGGQIELLGYDISSESFRSLRETIVTIAWRPVAPNPPSMTLFAHLVSADDGAIYGQQDIPMQPANTGIILSQLRLTPRLATQPGDYSLYVGAYESASGRALAAAGGAERLPLRSVEVQAMEQSPFTDHPILPLPWTGERQLVGYDWDHTLAPETRLYLHWRTPQGFVSEHFDNPAPESGLPSIPGPWGIARQPTVALPGSAQYYVPLGASIVWTGTPDLAGRTPSAGDTLALSQHFAAGRALQQDLVVSVRLIGYEADGVHWAWWDLHDTVPALGAIPTLKWINGSRIRDPHYLTVSPEAPAGQTLGALVTVYDAFTQRTLAILDERIIGEHLGIPLGTAQVE